MHGLKGLDLQTYRDLNWDRHPMARGSGASKAAKLKRAGARGRGMPQAAKLEVEHGLTNKNCGCPCKLWFDCKNLGFNKKDVCIQPARWRFNQQILGAQPVKIVVFF